MEAGETLVSLTLFLVIGLIWVTWLYFRSKEKQMIIERGLSNEEMITFYKARRNPFTMLKIGIVTIFFGFGLGFGMMLDNYTNEDFWIAFLLFTFSGLGFVISFLVSRKMGEGKID